VSQPDSTQITGSSPELAVLLLLLLLLLPVLLLIETVLSTASAAVFVLGSSGGSVASTLYPPRGMQVCAAMQELELPVPSILTSMRATYCAPLPLLELWAACAAATVVLWLPSSHMGKENARRMRPRPAGENRVGTEREGFITRAWGVMLRRNNRVPSMVCAMHVQIPQYPHI
jgi:hypothetical protein